jgi:hypothetical protein
MKKKVFSLMIVGLSMTSFLNLNASVKTDLINSVDCFAVATRAETAFMNDMPEQHVIPTNLQAYNVFAVAYDSSMELLDKLYQMSNNKT